MMVALNVGKPNYGKLDNLIKARGININKLSVETDIPKACIYDWKNGRTSPKADKLYKIAKYFGVTIDYFYEV